MKQAVARVEAISELARKRPIVSRLFQEEKACE
jgi:hypothetical protein